MISMNMQTLSRRWLAAVTLLLATIPSSRAAWVGFEAESGALGSDWAVSNSPSPAYITITTSTTTTNPTNATRMASYGVTFPAAGTYQLFAHVYVGSGAFNSDSFFIGNGFGAKNPTVDNNWTLVNGLASGGFNNSSDIVATGGSLGTGVWKWVNLGAAGYTVNAGSLTQIFQIGGRESGLNLDKFVFGTANYSFTVANLDNSTDGTPPAPPPPAAASVDATKTFQTIEGLGGAIAFYNGWVTAHPYKLELFTNAFAGLNLSMLRLGNWFRYQGTPNFDADAPGFVSNANRLLGHPIPVYMSSWAPPAFLKANGQVGNGDTLAMTNGVFAYTNFAQYWYDSLLAYQSNGVTMNWISIQNEPDWAASYDSCVFHPNEDTVNGTNYASYSKALDAVYQRLTNMPTPPKILGPEVVGIGFNDVQNYAATMHAGSFYGVAHHLYGGSTDGSPDGYIPAMNALTNVFPTKPRFMTEFGVSGMIEQANLIHNVLTVEQASGYNYWSLIWPGTSGGLIQIENPFNLSSWTNAPPGTTTQSHGWWFSPAYWAMKHFSYFIQPGYKRVAVTCNDTNILASSYLSTDGLRLVTVFVDRHTEGSSTVNVSFGAFPYFTSTVYQTADTNYFQSLGAVGSQITLPVQSLTTVVLDKFVAVGAAANPSPTNGASGVALNSALSWTPGTSSLTHALYLGTSSNTVALATGTSPEFCGLLTNSTFNPALFGNTTYYWRVDEIAGANTNTGAVWSFVTQPAPALMHRYSFSETNGTTVADSIGGPAWTGSLPNSGSFANGQLTLASNAQQYAALPVGIVSGLTNYTIETWVKLNSTVNWTRIFDFGNSTTSYMFLTPQNGSNTRLRFAISTNGSGGEQQITGPTALTPGVWYHLSITVTNNTGVLFVNGVPVGTNSAMTLKPAALGNTANNYLGKSQFSDPYMNGVLDEFRIYSTALSAIDIAATDGLGPDQAFSTNSPPLTTSATTTTLTLTWPLASADFTLQLSTNLLTGPWTNAPAAAPQIINGNWQVVVPLTNSNSAMFYRLTK